MAKKPLGAVLLHGFSGLPIGLGNLAQHVEDLGLPYRAPTLRGHGMESPNALLDVVWTDWIADVEKGMSELLNETRKITIIGHSLGGLLALYMATENQETIDSIIVAGGSTKSVSPLGPGGPFHFLIPLLFKFMKKKWVMSPLFVDQKISNQDTGYAWVPTTSWLQVFDLIKETDRRLPEITVPTLILHSKNDSVNSPKGAQIIYDTISTSNEEKKLIWFEKTEHVMFLDCEEAEINRAVVEYLQERLLQYD